MKTPKSKQTGWRSPPLWMIATSTVLLAVAGLILLQSTALESTAPSVWIKQAVWLSLGALLLVGAAFLGRSRYRFWIVAACPVALVMAVIAASGVGSSVAGARRWFEVFGLPLHLGTLLLVGQVAALAGLVWWVRRLTGPWPWLAGAVAPVALVAVTGGLLADQPDVASAALLLGVTFLVLCTELRTLAASGLLAITLPICGFLGWPLLAPYQRHRLFSWVQGEPAGYTAHLLGQLRQTDGLTGPNETGAAQQSFLPGAQTNFGTNASQPPFLPGAHTDFAFAAWRHEWGYLGAAILVLLFGLLVAGLTWVAVNRRRSGDCFGATFAAGTATLILLHVCLHLAVTNGGAPLLSIPLPLVSYGGSHVVTTLAVLGFSVGCLLRPPEAITLS